jgi:hypothetical protein
VERPSAATLVEVFQSHGNCHPESGYIGSCCARSDVPNLPIPRQLQASSPLSHSRNTAEWESLKSPPTTGWPGREGARTIDSPGVARARTRSPTSPVDSARQNTGRPTISKGFHHSVPVFQASLAPESFQVLEPQASSEEPCFHARSLRLYDMDAELYRITRRLVFLPSEDADLAEGREFWMPLADIAVVRRGAIVIISWSDCNHHESYTAVNGITPHSRVYMRMKPNNTLLIHFASPLGARDFTSHISEPRKAKEALRGWSINLSPYPISGAWGFDATGVPRKCSVLVNCTVQPFDCHPASNRGPSRGLLVKGGSDLTMSASRLYWLPPAIDIELGMDKKSDHTDPRPIVSLMDLFVTGYKSNIQRVHNFEKDKVGVFQEVELSKCSVSWRFENLRGDYHLRRNSRAQMLTSLQTDIRSSMASAHGHYGNARQCSASRRWVDSLGRRKAEPTFFFGPTKRAVPPSRSDSTRRIPARANGSQDVVSLIIHTCLQFSTLTIDSSDDVRGFGDLYRLDNHNQTDVLLPGRKLESDIYARCACCNARNRPRPSRHKQNSGHQDRILPS